MRQFKLALCFLLASAAPSFAEPNFNPSRTPAEIKIEAAQRTIDKDPTGYTAYNDLAFALTKRARETADPKYYEEALKHLAKSQELSPDNFEGQKIRVWALLGQHEFGEAYKLAKALNAKVPDDVQVYGLLVDAAVELGEYAEAEKAAQWMFNLRPGNGAALTRASYLREIFGDIDGALELMQMALQRIPPLEREERAWLQTQIAHLLMAQGKPDAAERFINEALKQFPDYHYALAQRGALLTKQGKLAEAIDAYRKRYEVAPHPENMFDIGAALHAAGKTTEAKNAFQEFEQLALKESEGWDNANRELIRYYTDYANQPAKALKIAEMQIKQRRDVYSLESHAWALYRNGKFRDAKKSMDVALAVGVIEPRMLFRAAMIEAKLGDKSASTTLLKKAEAAHPDANLLDSIRRAASGKSVQRVASAGK
jgi:tetratricopeptide (TPR) repeat protein